MNTLQLLKYPSNRKNETFWSALIVIVLIAAFFRFSGLHWDEGFPYTPHPDERAILMKSREIEMPPLSKLGTLFNEDESTWNPRWFPYGSFPLYVLEISENILERVTGTDVTDLRTLARSISVLADLGTIIGIAMLGKSAFSRRVGILAALLISFSVIHIQLAHFFAFDTLTVFFTTWSLLVLYRLTFSGKISHSLLAGALIGLGLATKVSLLPIAGAFVMAHLIYAARDQTLEDIQYWKVKKALISGAWGIVAGLLIFVLAQPYALLDWNRFIGDVTEQSEMVRRIRDYPYTRQYIGTTPYLYQFIHMGKWGLGWPLTIISVVGLFWAASKGLKLVHAILSILCCVIIPALILLWNNNAPAIMVSSLICFFSLILFWPFRDKGASGLILLLSWVLPYLLVTGSFEVKFLRYLLPAIPIITLLGSAFLIHCFNRIPRYSQISSACLILLTVVATAWYGLSMTALYGEKHTAVKASEWLVEYGKSGSLIIKEHWEESLPNLSNFRYTELPIYEDDTYIKLTRISDSLQRGDYLVLFSNRLYGTVTRIEDRYPVMKGYYIALFTGKLGYEPVLVQTSYLNLFGINLIEDTFDRPAIPDPTKRLIPPHDIA
ncbi:MAG: glycosyltransferase family 39 protein, partial [Chloroflexota bacterium]|nr:glycosyltransferase family 39 protein [Chloroflexota bacterium]